MEKKYSISQLVSLLGISRTAVNRKIKKYSFDTVQEYVNGRPMKLVCVKDEELEALLEEVKHTKGGASTVSSDAKKLDNTVLNELPPYEEKPEKAQPVNNSGEELVKKVLDQNEKILEQLQHYVDRVVTAESQLKLIETSEKNKEDEYLKIKAENEHLKAKLAEQEKKQNWWKFW